MPVTALATCEIYGTIYDVFGQPVQGAIVGVMAIYKNGALVLSKTKEVATDVDGYFTMDLPRDSVAILYANTPGLNISCLGTPTAIPDADAAELTTIIGDFDLWNEVPVAIPIGAGVSSFNGRRGDVVLLSSDVTGALGYTPADAAALADYVPLAGGAMTGFLTLSGNPLSTFHAATKNYVDQEILDAVASIPPSGVSSVNGRTGDVVLTGADVSSALGYTPVNKAGDTMLGALVLSADPLVNLEAATKHYVDIQIAAGGVNTTADYYWTGKHEFAGPSPAVRANTYATRVGGFMSFTSDSTIAMNATSAAGQMQFNGPQGSSFRILAGAATVTHSQQIVLSLGSLPGGGGTVVFQCFDNSFQQRPLYFMTDNGRHFFNAPALTDTGNVAVTIYADNTHGSAYGFALQCNGKAVFTGAVTLPSATPVNATDAASKAYVDAHSAGVDLAANYPWTGNHSWTQALVMKAGSSLASTYAGGTVTPMLYISNVNHAANIGPSNDYGGGISGSAVYYLCGTGAWSSSSYGAVAVNAFYPWNNTWDFMAHANVRGALQVEGTFQAGVAKGLILGYQVPLKTTYADGAAIDTIYDDGTYFHIGPQYAAAAGAVHGRYVLHQCGTGAYEGAPGSVNQHGPLATWYYSAHITFGAGYYLTLGQDPLYPLHATTKKYVDRGGAGAILATYAATFATDATLGKYFRIPLTGPLTLAAPTGMVDGQTVTWEFVQDTAGGHAVTLDVVFVAGSGGGFTVTPAANARSYFVGAYHASSGKWDILATSGGYV